MLQVMKKNIVFLLFILLFSSFVYAESIGTFEKEKDIEIYQTCNNCTYCNFTAVKYPNSTNLFTNLAAIQDNSYFYYTITAPNITEVGNYKYCYDCGNLNERETGCVNFEVTPNGTSPTNSQGMLYGILFLFAVVLLSALLILGANINGDKFLKDNMTMEVTGVNWNKYYRHACFFFAYMVFIWVAHLGYEIASGFLYTSFLGSFFYMLFKISLALLLPIFIMFLIFIIVGTVIDKKNQSMFERGLKP